MNKNEESPEVEIVNDIDIPRKSYKPFKFVKNFGFGTAVFGMWWMSILFSIFQLLFAASVGFGMLAIAYNFFLQGSYILAILALLIGTPIAVGIAYCYFIILFFIAIIAGIIYLALLLLGIDITYGEIISNIWRIGWILILIWCWYLILKGGIHSIKQKNVGRCLITNCIYILILILLTFFTIRPFLYPATEEELSVNVNEFYEWCEATEKKPSDFPRIYNNVLIEYISEFDPDAINLEKIIYVEGNDLHISLTFISNLEEEFDVSEMFRNLEMDYRKRIYSAQSNKFEEEGDKCIYGFINETYENVILHGPNDIEVVIPV